MLEAQSESDYEFMQMRIKHKFNALIWRIGSKMNGNRFISLGNFNSHINP